VYCSLGVNKLISPASTIISIVGTQHHRCIAYMNSCTARYNVTNYRDEWNSGARTDLTHLFRFPCSLLQ